jgi:hypothetical protein
MTRISFLKSLLNVFRFRYLGWRVLSVAALLIVGLALWQLGVAGHEQPNAVKHTSSLLTPATARPANDSTLKEPYDLSLIDADPGYYKRVDPQRLYQVAPIPAGQKRHEELRIVGEAYRLAIPQSWLEQSLVVLAKPGRPVTFVALDSGKFVNDEISITIKADERGLASAAFFVTDEGRYRVLAGSPENAGPAAFNVNCMTQARLDDLRSGRYAQQYLTEVKANKKREAAAAADLAERIRQRRTIK